MSDVATIIKCKCSHEFQDKTYGKSMRVHTPSAKDGVYFCTVCGTEKRQDSKK